MFSSSTTEETLGGEKEGVPCQDPNGEAPERPGTPSADCPFLSGVGRASDDKGVFMGVRESQRNVTWLDGGE